jgi:hypothetical protein
MNHSREYLQMQVDAFGRDQARLAAWMLDHGREFTVDERTFKGRRMRPKSCFENATKMVLRDASLTYVEGYVSVLIPIHHAWVMRKDGSIIDPTLSLKTLNGTARTIDGYFGVPFSYDYLAECISINKVYGILDGMNHKTLPDLIEGKVDFTSENKERLAWTS